MSQFLTVDNLKQFLEHHPDSVAFAHLAARMIDEGDYLSAIEVCRNGLEKHPHYSFAHFILGTAHYHLKNYTDAKKQLEKALAYDPNNPRAWEILSAINEILNLNDDARESNLQAYLIDYLNKDSSSHYLLQKDEEEIPDSVETAEEREDLAETRLLEAETAEAGDAESILNQIVTGSEEEYDFEKALDEVFKDKESYSTAEKEESEPVEDHVKKETGSLEKDDAVSAEEFSSAIESFFQDYEKEESAADKAEISDLSAKENVGTGEEEKAESDESSMALTGDQEDEDKISASESPVSEDDDQKNPAQTRRVFEVEETEDDQELEEFPPLNELIEEKKDQEEADKDSSHLVSDVEFMEALAETENPDEIMKKQEEIEEKSVQETEQDNELMDFTSFVSDVISETEGESEESEKKATDEEDFESTLPPSSVEEESTEVTDTPLQGEKPAPKKDLDDYPKEEDFEFPDVQAETLDSPAIKPEIAKTSEDVDEEPKAKFSRPPILSPTLGEIYIAQGRFEEAIDVFAQLLDKDPENSRYRRKIDDLKKILAKKKEGS